MSSLVEFIKANKLMVAAAVIAYIYLKENSHSSFSNSVEASEGYDERYKELQQMNVGDRTKSGNIIENGNVLKSLSVNSHEVSPSDPETVASGSLFETNVGDYRTFPSFEGEPLSSSKLLPNSAVPDTGLENIKLVSGNHIGINTVGSSLRIASHDIRSLPPNPQTFVSPWNMSTVTPDLNKLNFNIGC